MHVCFESLYISQLPFSAKQQREMTKSPVFGDHQSQWLNFDIFFGN